jgi:RimJ/RimL family protein N-acetyltransferase
MLECTAVFEPFRRRGIAWALKLRTARWAKERGLRRLVTCNDSANEGMLHINTRMGFDYRLTQLGMLRGEDRPLETPAC